MTKIPISDVACVHSSFKRQIGVTKETLAPYPIAMPSLDKQVTVAANINALSADTQCLTQIYEQKLGALAALKKSLLHQAFSGEL